MMDTFLLSMLWHRHSRTRQQSAVILFSPVLQVFCKSSVSLLNHDSYLESLLTNVKTCWTVSFPVLEKPSSRPWIHVSSGTHTSRGVGSWLSKVGTMSKYPEYVN